MNEELMNIATGELSAYQWMLFLAGLIGAWCATIAAFDAETKFAQVIALIAVVLSVLAIVVAVGIQIWKVWLLA